MIMIVWNLVSSCLTILPIAEWCYYKWELNSIIQNLTEQAGHNIQNINDSIRRDKEIARINAKLDNRPYQKPDISFWIEKKKFVRTMSQEEITAATKKHNEKSLITKPLGVLGFAMLAAGKVWQIFMQN